MIELSVFKQSLNKLADALDISDSAYDKIETSYKSLGEWFCRDNSGIKEDKPEIYPQGSFKLGTAIKPITDEDDYDIDLVCQLNSPKITIATISQKDLKEKIGKEIALYAESQKMRTTPEEKKRCWRLSYADPKYHLDALPALSNPTACSSSTCISITNNTKSNYKRIHPDWESSDPKGYAEWFKKRMEVRFNEIRSRMADDARATVEDIPEHRVKTPLQRGIQILKRHRDIMFKDDSDNKPISIIITTLAGLAYNNEADLYDALNSIVNGMERHITKKDGVDWVANPVHQEENFADKWSKNKTLRDNFYTWLSAAKEVFSKMKRSETYDEVASVMKSAFGGVVADKVASYFPQSPTVKSAPLVIESNSSHKPQPWRK